MTHNQQRTHMADVPFTETNTMSQKQLTPEELNGLIIEVLYETGPITGGDLMSRTGIGGPEPMKGLVTGLIEAGYVGQDGKGKDATFGLTDKGITLAEDELGLGQPEEAEGGEEPEVVYDDEFSQDPPAKTAPTRVAPARGAGGKAPAKAAPVAASKAPAKAPAKAPVASSKGQVAPARAAVSTKAPAKAATRVKVGQPEAENDKILEYRNLDDYTVEELQNEVDVCEENARAFVDSAAKLRDGSVDLTDPYAILAATLLRTVSRYKRRIKNGNKRPARS